MGLFLKLCIYIYIYVSFNIKRGFYYLGDSGNYVYLYIHFYLSILKEAFIIWGVVFADVFLFIPNLHDVLNKMNIISAAACLWGINMNDEYFYVRGWVFFGDVFLFIPNLAQFSFMRKNNRKTTDKQFKLNCYIRKRSGKGKRKRKRKRKRK